MQKKFIISNDNFSIHINKKFFEPNLTTMLLIEMAKRVIKKEIKY